MDQKDNQIFELLDESELILSPAVAASNLNYSRNWLSQRMSKFKDGELIKKVDGSYYRITG
ncbi:hypothetical protein AArc1_2916 [Natrarchaeobaculum sulfurireducens]|uniref:Uncharacterized protein n=2 Tax=Natrarchaeobaculum sulfurireducens TaxID=2044521 RepID=A0A346PI80_9EURY|nr:hypothetical protein AArc1_2916 [Natrarchaeobaculum sulfurireducens]